ncbi:hypothetical protein CLIB1423_38S00408 [[Candida] railenensis]|uniref:SEC7 domain-containing protein n=1 Tax=[Candida] railenensis TaxID=45579 RepID=A0A9P0QVR5_9ASCO|nr:hypothetical protein CLIB1423_38S00408 [[Candida] railenensis]
MTADDNSTGAIRHDLTPPSTPPSPSHSVGAEKFQANGAANPSNLETIKDESSSAHANVDAKTTSTDESVETANEELSPEAEQKEIAIKLFKEEFVSIQPEEYTQFLAANDNESTNIREFYMDLFQWDANLLKSTRMLCSKLYLKGESQEIDRILSSFTKSYIKQHPTNVFCTRNFEKIYIVLYSLILLNTALHNSELNKKSKISQADYIKNTFSTFIQQNPKSSKKLSIKQRITIERVLSTYYEDLSKNELHLKQSDEPSNGGDFNLMAKQNELKHQQRNKRMSAVDSVLSRDNGSIINSYRDNGNNTNNNTNGNGAGNYSNGNYSNNQDHNNNNSIQASIQRPLPPVPSNNINDMNEFPNLSRQVSGSSIWSTDTNGNRRQSLSMKRMSTTSSAVSQYTAANTSSSTLGGTRNSARVGFTRALASDQNNQKYYNGSDSRLGNIPYSVRNRQSLNQLRGAPGPTSLHSNSLNKRSSRASIISRESNASLNGEDTLSVLSLDTFNINEMNFGEEQFQLRQQHLDDFNVEDYQDQYDLTLELQGSPYLKEGLLRLKILHNDQLDNSTTNTQEISQPNVPQPQTATGRFFSFFTKTSAPAQQQSSGLSSSATAGSSTIAASRFVENFVVVSKGELQLYSFDPKVIKKHQQKLKKMHKNQQIQDESDDEIIGDGNWLKNAANIGNYNLCSTLAQLEKNVSSASGGSSSGAHSNKVLWSLTFPKVSKKQPKKFIFEAGTTEVALEFINTCNFWASKITAIPTLEESVSSIEYGWTNLEGLIANKDNFKKLKNIQKWEQLPQGTFLSNYMVTNGNELNSGSDNHLGMMKQFVCTLNYYNNLKRHYKDFNLIKARFVKNFNFKGVQSSSNYHKIINNYEIKNEQYKFELNKYKNYLIVLGFGLQLRFDLEDQDKEANNNEEIDDAEMEGSNNGSNAGSVEVATTGQVIDGENLESKDSELTQLVKFEIGKLFINLKDIGKIIPTFASSRSLNNLSEIRKGNINLDDPNNQFPLVKSPKTFTLANYKDNESPVTKLIQSQSQAETNGISDKDIMHSHSTNTITEEDEPDSDTAPERGIPPAASPLSAISMSNGSIKTVQQQTLNVARAHIVKVSD